MKPCDGTAADYQRHRKRGEAACAASTAAIALQNKLRRWGEAAGVPYSVPRQPVSERFWSKVQTAGLDECWMWTGGLTSCGYGSFGDYSYHTTRAHRFAYEELIGPVPDGLQLDHVCHNVDGSCLGGRECPHRRCVNPWHLDPVTTQVNTARSGLTLASIYRLQTKCKNGHLYEEHGRITIGSTGQPHRVCKACDNARLARRRKAPTPDHVHGTLHGYASYGCRCEPCSEAMREYRRRPDRVIAERARNAADRARRKAQRHDIAA